MEAVRQPDGCDRDDIVEGMLGQVRQENKSRKILWVCYSLQLLRIERIFYSIESGESSGAGFLFRYKIKKISDEFGSFIKKDEK